MSSSEQLTAKIAVVGCGHGELHKTYRDAESQCLSRGWTLADLDLLIICGDFQAYRNSADLNCASVPRKYQRLVDFPDYYSGKAVAPVLTLVIGGNHEASNYFFELFHGGWLAPNIYYLGAAGVVRYGPWRIAGLSGIYNAGDYRRPHHERIPYDRDDIKSIYHVREYDVSKLLRVTGPVDIGLSHDWPMWVELFGEHEKLYKERPHFLQSAMTGRLGSMPAKLVLDGLRPRYWLSGHMHCRFEAAVQHKEGQTIDETTRQLLVSEDITKLPIFKEKETLSGTGGSDKPATTTEFLGLSKPGNTIHNYMSLLELDLPDQKEELYLSEKKGDKFSLCYDEEWLAIIRAYNDRLRVADPQTLVVPPVSKGHSKDVSAKVLASHRNWVKENISEKGLLRIPENFERHAPVHDGQDEQSRTYDQPDEYPNSQTVQLAELLQMENRLKYKTEEEDDISGDFAHISFG